MESVKMSVNFSIFAMMILTLLVFVTNWDKAKKEREKARMEIDKVVFELSENLKISRQLTTAVKNWNMEAESLRHWMNETLQALDKCNDALIRSEAREIMRGLETEQRVEEFLEFLGESEKAAIIEIKNK